jgi:hypothetical protein
MNLHASQPGNEAVRHFVKKDGREEDDAGANGSDPIGPQSTAGIVVGQARVERKTD